MLKQWSFGWWNYWISLSSLCFFWLPIANSYCFHNQVRKSSENSLLELAKRHFNLWRLSACVKATHSLFKRQGQRLMNRFLKPWKSDPISQRGNQEIDQICHLRGLAHCISAGSSEMNNRRHVCWFPFQTQFEDVCLELKVLGGRCNDIKGNPGLIWPLTAFILPSSPGLHQRSMFKPLTNSFWANF
jgi:hypothetical protein